LLNILNIYVLSCVRYYAIATPSATQRLLLGLLEAPPSWAPDALDAAVQLVELLRAAEDYVSGIRVSWIL
jgi:GIGANTEA protein